MVDNIERGLTNSSETSYFNINFMQSNRFLFASEQGKYMTVKIPSSFTQLHKTIYKQTSFYQTNFHQSKFAVKQLISTCSLNNVTLSFVFLKGNCISILDPCKGASG